MAIDATYKSFFVLPAVLLSAVLAIVSLVAAMLADKATVAWLGALLASLPLPATMAYLVFGNVERTSENLPLMLLVCASGAMLAGWQQFISMVSGWGPTGVAVASLVLLLLYVFWYSRFGRRPSAQLVVGGRLPVFSLPDAAGGRFESAALAGRSAVLVFYRGNWCPLCMAQVREVAARYHDMAALGIEVLLISPQPDELSRELAARFDVPLRFLVDEGNRLADELGIAVANGVPLGVGGGYAADTVMPTVVVCNERGTIVFSDQSDNYRVRPEPDVFLAILRRMGALAQ